MSLPARVALLTISVVLTTAIISVALTGGVVEAQEASFTVSNLNSPASATTGSEITVKATIKNTGNVKGSTTIEYRFDGNTESSKSITLKSGGKTTVSFKYTIPNLESGSYQHGVFIGGTDNGETTNIVIDQASPSFSISKLDAPSRASPGDQITVQATVVNKGTASGSTTVEYRLDGDTLASKTVSLGAGKSTTISLTATIPNLQHGEYTQGAFIGTSNNGRTSSLIVEGAAQFRVTDLDAPSRADVDERIRVEARVTNTGDGAGSTQIQYRIGGKRIDTQTVQLEAGASKRVVFSVRIPSISTGNYTQGVYLGSSNTGATGRLRITGTASFDVSNFKAPARASAGDRVTVSATIRNTGNDQGSIRIEYRFDDDRLASESVRLNSGARTTVSFTARLPNTRTGTYRHGIFVGSSTRGQTASIVLQDPVARFDISGLTAPKQATIGDQTSISATVTNTGTRSESTTVEYRVGGRVLASQSVTLDPGQSRTVSLHPTYTEFTAGSYTQGVYRASTTQGETASLSLEGVPAFEVANLQSPARVTQGDRITVGAQIRNSGTAAGSTSVQYRVGQEVRSTKQVTLQPGERTTVTFEIRASNDPGTYRHGVFVGTTDRGQSSSLVIEGQSPEFSVSNLRSPSRATVGDQITVEGKVSNTGTGSGTTAVQYRIGTDVIRTKQVSLRPGETTPVSFDVSMDGIDPGTYRHGIYIGESDRGQTSSLVVVSGQARFTVGNLQGPAEATVGDEVTVEAAVINTGSGEGSISIEYRIAGNRVAAQSITLAPGASTEVSFTATVPDMAAGTYRHGVFLGESNSGQTSGLVITRRATPTEAPGLVGFHFVVGILALLLVTTVLTRRRG